MEHKLDYWLWEVVSLISDDYIVQVEKLLQIESRLRFTYMLACLLSQSLTVNSISVQILVSSTGSITKCIYLPYLLSKQEGSSSC